MRTIVMWLRQVFCRHEWETEHKYEVSRRVGPVGQVIIEKCSKCAWRRRLKMSIYDLI